MGKGTLEQKKAKILKVLELQDQGITYKNMTDKDCFDLFGYKQKKTIHGLMTNAGYKYDRNKGIFVEELEQQIDGQLTISETISSDNMIDNIDNDVIVSDKHRVNPIQDDENKETSVFNASDKYQINITAEKMQRIDKMLEWFESIQSIETINNNLTFDVKAPNKSEDRKTIYIDKNLWDRLDRFYQSHRQYKKNDLINQAIYEYLEKIENIIK